MPAASASNAQAAYYSVFNASRRARAGGEGDGADTSQAPGGSSAAVNALTKLFPISIADLEQRHRATADGAESSLWSGVEEEEENDGVSRRQEGGPRSNKRKAAQCQKPEGQPRRRGVSEDEAINGALFGASASQGSEFSDDDDNSQFDDTSNATERRVNAHQRAFHIRGVNCLGCSMDREQVDKVDRFVRENQNRLEQTALFKAASLFWKQLVVDPAKAENVEIPDWEWKNLRSHYLLHALMPEVQRGDCIRQLSAMRKTLEMSMLREDEDGNRSLDPKHSELMLKLIGMQSKELQLFQASSMPPPPPRGGAPR